MKQGLWMLHFLGYTAIVGVITWGIEGRDLAGDVARSMVIALAMLPFLTDLAARQGKPWHAWRSYAFVALWGVVTVALEYVPVLRSPWITVVAFIIGTMMVVRHHVRKRQQQQ